MHRVVWRLEAHQIGDWEERGEESRGAQERGRAVAARDGGVEADERLLDANGSIADPVAGSGH